MTDLEITRLCAEAMDIDFGPELYATTIGQQMNNERIMRERVAAYDPLHDDAQAMALIKKFGLVSAPDDGYPDGKGWSCGPINGPLDRSEDVSATTLNHAICECVAKMQAAKVPA